MNITFRADASLHIGTGHVMRCLTLADALSAQSANCQFICRQHEGHLIELIRSKGYVVHVLTAQNTDVEAKTKALPSTDKLAHSHWLGTSQAQDAAACAPILAMQPPDWLVVDHYALDTRWESALMPHYRKLMVIDDLADRHHVCDLLLDQTFDRSAYDYRPLVPEHCQLLCGAAYALLRPEFAALRPYSLQRRAQPALRQLLINMGGVDKDNVTGQVLQALHDCPLPADCHIMVVMGANAPWLDSVRQQAQSLPWSTTMLVGVNNMAQLMADSDLAIGAAGGTSWERCCLGLPTIMLVLAENQKKIAKGLENAEAVKRICLTLDISAALKQLVVNFNYDPSQLLKISKAAANIINGQGLAATLQKMGKALNPNLRRMQAADLETVLAWRNHVDVRRYMYTQHEITFEEHSKWFARASQDSKKHLLVFEIERTPMGFINIHEIAAGGIADWGFYVAPKSPKGTGKVLGLSALKYAFEDIGLHKLCGQVLENNERSMQFHKSLGFKVEGILHHQYFDGQKYCDIHCFGILASDWQQLHS